MRKNIQENEIPEFQSMENKQNFWIEMKIKINA